MMAWNPICFGRTWDHVWTHAQTKCYRPANVNKPISLARLGLWKFPRRRNRSAALHNKHFKKPLGLHQRAGHAHGANPLISPLPIGCAEGVSLNMTSDASAVPCGRKVYNMFKTLSATARFKRCGSLNKLGCDDARHWSRSSRSAAHEY